MKHKLLIVLLLCALLLSSCAEKKNAKNNSSTSTETQSGVTQSSPDSNTTPEPPVTDEPQEPSAPVEPIYSVENYTESKNFETEDGILYGSYNYQIPILSISNPDELSPEALEIANRNVAAFNAQMQQILEESVAYGTELAEDPEYSPLTGNWTMPATDEKILTVSQTGQILSVLADCYFYSGGAHPHAYNLSYIFDLTLGLFIDPTQIGDDPETFRVQAAQLLIAKAESLGEEYTTGYWADYKDIISNWNATSVVFRADGMTVIFSAYELGPYAMGPVELHLTYPELAEAIGEGGLAHLGVVLAE